MSKRSRQQALKIDFQLARSGRIGGVRCARDLQHRRGAAPFRSARLLVFTMVGLALAGCATTTGPHSFGLDASRAALVRETCADIMNLPAGVPQWRACTASLAGSLRRQRAAQRLQQAKESCERQGLLPGTAELDQCAVLAWQANTMPRVDNPVPAPAVAAQKPDPTISFFKMDPRLKHEREQLACAHLGLDPTTYAFGECVGDLQQSFFDLEIPP